MVALRLSLSDDCARSLAWKKTAAALALGYCSSVHAKPSRATSALAAAGPQVPAV